MIHFRSNNDFKNKPEDFKWKHFSHEIILWAVRWYRQFALSYRDLVWMFGGERTIYQSYHHDEVGPRVRSETRKTSETFP